MAIAISGISKSKVLSNLNTYNHTALQTSMYTVSIRLTEIPPSGVSIVIKQNSSTIATSVAPSSTQNHIELRAQLNCTINDVIGVVLSSAVASDSLANTVKAILDINIGAL